MRLELGQIATLCIALFLGGSMSLCLFLVMVFLIEPERAVNSHVRHPYVVTFVTVEHKNKTKNTRGRSIAMPKFPGPPELTRIRANGLKRSAHKKISTHIPNIRPPDLYGAGHGNVFNFNTGSEENNYPVDNHTVPFNRVARKYLQSKREKSPPPERFRLVGGGEVDRIGNTCFEISGAGGSASSDIGQTAIEKDLEQSHAMNSLTAHQVSCNKTDSSLTEDFMKQLKKRGLIMAPFPVTG